MQIDDKDYLIDRERGRSRRLGLSGCWQIFYIFIAAFLLTCLCGVMRGQTNPVKVTSPVSVSYKYINDQSELPEDRTLPSVITNNVFSRPPLRQDLPREPKAIEVTTNSVSDGHSVVLKEIRKSHVYTSKNIPPPMLIHNQQSPNALSPKDRFRYAMKCYSPPTNPTSEINLLPDILLETTKLQNGSNIFFHDTSCLQGLVKLTARQACSIESAAKSNPDSQIWTLFTANVGFKPNVERTSILKALEAYPNIHFRNLNLWKYAEGTPAEQWVKKPDLLESRYLFEHVADFLRLVSLYKFGGTYFDMDFIVIQSLDNISNYAGIESTNNLSNGVLNFDFDGIGHYIVDKILREFIKTFIGKKWSINGPLLITRMIQDICRAPELIRCTIFKAYPEKFFYPINYSLWHRFFETNSTLSIIDQILESKAVHMWNKLTAKETVRIGEYTPYEMLASEYCPRVYETMKVKGVF